jgi:hypothetical protein
MRITSFGLPWSIDALSGRIVNGEDNHVVLAKVAQRMLRACFDLAYAACSNAARFSVDCYVACSAKEIEQMGPRFDCAAIMSFGHLVGEGEQRRRHGEAFTGKQWR